MERIRHLKYSSYEHRLNTFENWSKSKTQTKQQMAEAGFFHINKKDLVMCFHCGLGLDDWSEQDPWRRHALWNNSCPYVIKNKGERYMENLKENFRENYVRKVVSITGNRI